MANDHSGFHDAYEVELNGKKITVDCGIIDLVMWLNEVPGVDTFTSCQGGTACCRMDAFVGFRSVDPKWATWIHEQLGCGRLTEHNDQYELSFEVSELIALNERLFPESPCWKDAFKDKACAKPEEKQP